VNALPLEDSGPVCGYYAVGVVTSIQFSSSAANLALTSRLQAKSRRKDSPGFSRISACGKTKGTWI
jgi:hypothetical protein